MPSSIRPHMRLNKARHKNPEHEARLTAPLRRCVKSLPALFSIPDAECRAPDSFAASPDHDCYSANWLTEPPLSSSLLHLAPRDVRIKRPQLHPSSRPTGTCFSPAQEDRRERTARVCYQALSRWVPETDDKASKDFG